MQSGGAKGRDLSNFQHQEEAVTGHEFKIDGQEFRRQDPESGDH